MDYYTLLHLRRERCLNRTVSIAIFLGLLHSFVDAEKRQLIQNKVGSQDISNIERRRAGQLSRQMIASRSDGVCV